MGKLFLGTSSFTFSFPLCKDNMICDVFLEGLLIGQHSEVKICPFSQQIDINLLIFCRHYSLMDKICRYLGLVRLKLH